jgi:hypothetical protein
MHHSNKDNKQLVSVRPAMDVSSGFTLRVQGRAYLIGFEAIESGPFVDGAAIVVSTRIAKSISALSLSYPATGFLTRGVLPCLE